MKRSIFLFFIATMFGSLVSGAQFYKGVSQTSGFYDVNKTLNADGSDWIAADANACWAAASANVIRLWYDSLRKSGYVILSSVPNSSANEIYKIVRDVFTPGLGNNSINGISWFVSDLWVSVDRSNGGRPLRGDAIRTGGFWKTQYCGIKNISDIVSSYDISGAKSSSVLPNLL